MSTAESGNSLFQSWMEEIIAEGNATRQSLQTVKYQAEHLSKAVDTYLEYRNLGLFDGTFEGERDMVAQADFLCHAAGIEAPKNIELFLLMHDE